MDIDLKTLMSQRKDFSRALLLRVVPQLLRFPLVHAPRSDGRAARREQDGGRYRLFVCSPRRKEALGPRTPLAAWFNPS